MFVFTFAGMTVVSAYYTFPCISWWGRVMGADRVIFDGYEHFEKMTYRNKYHISGANNSIKLSVPLVNGRNQRVAMKEVRIHNDTRWQVQHWRTLVSVYRGTPFFEHYEDSLQRLFETHFDYLIDFNKASLQWVKQQVNMQYEEQEAPIFIKDYPQGVVDLRCAKPVPARFPRYYQVFEERIGFQPDLSILDLLFSEGPATKAILQLV